MDLHQPAASSWHHFILNVSLKYSPECVKTQTCSGLSTVQSSDWAAGSVLSVFQMVQHEAVRLNVLTLVLCFLKSVCVKHPVSDDFCQTVKRSVGLSENVTQKFLDSSGSDLKLKVCFLLKLLNHQLMNPSCWSGFNPNTNPTNTNSANPSLVSELLRSFSV